MLRDASSAKVELLDRLVGEAERYCRSMPDGVAKDEIEELLFWLLELRDEARAQSDLLERLASEAPER